MTDRQHDDGQRDGARRRAARAADIHVVARSHPADVPSAGRARWAEVFPLAKGRAALSVGAVDVSGQPAAQQFSERLRMASRISADAGVISAVALSTLDGVLRSAAPRARATAVYAVHDSANRSLELSSAGPCPPAIVTPFGATSLAAAASSPLGTRQRAYDTVSVPFPAGSSLVLLMHTIACSTGPPASDVLVSRIAEARLSARGRNTAGRVCTALAHQLSCPHPTHQTTVLVARTDEERDPDNAAQWFPARAESAAAARAFTLRVMDEWDLDEKANRASVIAGELATNAIQHSAKPFEVRLHRTPAAVILEVVDGNAEPATRTAAGPYDAGHRGLTIVQTLADRWGTRRYGTGKIVWAELRLEPRPRDSVLDPPPEQP